MGRQKLTELDSRLKHTKLMFSVSLQRDFSKEPAYWIEVYKGTLPNSIKIYTVAIQWSFRRQGDLIEGHTFIDEHVRNLNSVARLLEMQVTKKIDDGWKYDGFEIAEGFPTHDQAVTEIFDNLIIRCREYKANEPTTPAKKVKPKTLNERFEQAQKERGRKALW